MKLQLVNPPIVAGYDGVSKSGAYQPLDLQSLATYVGNYLKDTEIEILDGELLTQQEIESRIDADFVGVSAKVLNYENCLSICAIAKEMGSKTIMGGPYASSIALQIMKNRSYVDFVVQSDGEKALLSILKGEEVSSIKNVLYRKEGRVFVNPVETIGLSLLPSPSYDYIDMRPYFINFERIYTKTLKAKKAIAMYSSKGCQWRDLSGGCTYCRPDMQWRIKKPQKVWQEIETATSLYGIDFVWDCSDTFTSSKEWITNLVNTKPSYLNPRFLFYARPGDIDIEMTRLLKELNVYQVLIGVDSGDNKILGRTRTGKRLEDIQIAARLFAQNDILFFPTFVFGLKGENHETVYKTLRLIEELVSYGNVRELSRSILFPLPGTPIFNDLMAIPIIKEKYEGKDVFDWEELQLHWVKNFCKIGLNELKAIVDAVGGKAEIKSGFAVSRK